MSKPVKHYEFGDYALDLSQRILLHEGRHIPLTPKAYDILLALVENNGRIVSKEELMQRVWPDSFVEEINLAKNISVLRKTLTNGADGREFIDTVARRGYRFRAEVREIVEEQRESERAAVNGLVAAEVKQIAEIPPEPGGLPKSESPPVEASPISRTPLIRRWPYLLGAGALLLAALGVWSYFAESQGSFESQVLPHLKTTLIAGWKAEPTGSLLFTRVSPDGNLVAYPTERGGQTDLFVKQINGGGEPIKVTNDPWREFCPTWSPDGQRLAYLSLRNGRYETWIIPHLGGPGRMIATLEVRNHTELFRWSRDGNRLYYEAEGNVYALDPASGAVSNVTSFDPRKSRKTHLRLSPDEQWLTYAEPVGGVAHIWAAPLAGGAPAQVTREGEDNRSPQWLPDGQRIVYGSRRNGVFQICVAYRDGRTPVQLTFGHANLEPWFPAPDGRRILYVSAQQEADLFRCDLKTGVETPVNRGALMEISPTFAPDGQTIAFQQTDNTINLSLSTLLATGSEAPLRLATEASDPRWSPRTGRVAFLRQTERLWSLWTVRSDGADERLVVKENVVPGGYAYLPFNWTQPWNYSWSPEGSRLAYISAQSGALNVWTIGGDGQGETMVSDNADFAVKLFCPVWSPDGRRIAYLTQKRSADTVSRRALIAEDGNNRAIFESSGQVRMLGWSETGGEFLIGLVENPNPGQVADAKLLRLSLAGGGATVVAEFPSIYPATLSLAPDRRRVAFVARPREPEGNDELWVAEVKGGQRRKVLASADPNVYLGGLVWSPEANSLCFNKQSRTTAIWAIENFR